MPATTIISPQLDNCPVCDGTGRDTAFNSVCDCTRFVSRSIRSVMAERLGDVTLPTLPQGGGTGTGRTNGSKFANKYGGKCVVCADWVEAETGLRVRQGQGWAVRHAPDGCSVPCSECSTLVRRGQGMARRDADGNRVVRHTQCPTAAPARPARTGSGIDLTGLPTTGEATWFAVPGVDTRLKVRIRTPRDGKWAGYVFVDDGAAYGYGKRYGRQNPGDSYQGDIEAELAAIVADPQGALRKYASITGSCGICNRPLEDAASVARGIGPVCARKLGWS